MSSIYKYDEFQNEEEFEYWSKRYGGKFTYLSKLPHNTKFHVENGIWEGKVIHKEDGVYLQTTLDDSLCINGENQMKINDKYYAWITILQ